MTFIRRWSVPLLACAMQFCALRGFAAAEEIKAPQPQETTLSADEVIARMVKVYETCQSYRDEGVVETEIMGVMEKKPFSTYFVRPNLFRYEFTHFAHPWGIGPKHRYVVWWDAKTIRSWWTVKPATQTHDSFGSAIAGPTGISGKSASRIPSLLVPGTHWGSGFKLVKGSILLGEESIDEILCYKIEFSHRSNELVSTVWIDKQRFVLLKIIEVGKAGEMKFQTLTTYQPIIDAAIDPTVFDFEPPRAGINESNAKPQ